MLGRNFNPRSREGSDRSFSRYCFYLEISIHAPARGATQPPSIASCVKTYFNPRSREGSDKGITLELINCLEFQSTLPRGERHSPCRHKMDNLPISIHAPARGATLTDWNTQTLTLNFNPRSREGSDGEVAQIYQSRQRFQSTLPRGERPVDHIRQSRAADISIHAPARGATANITYFFYIKDSYLSNIHKLQYFLTIQI